MIGAFATVALAASMSMQASVSDRLIDVGGLTLHVRCAGTRQAPAPMVILEAGAGNSANTWKDVWAPIAGFARVCAYDRPGLGTSQQTTQPRRPLDIIATLHGLLNAAGEQPPYVMAGHSWGGEIVRLYATRYPSEIVGLVLIDSSHEEQVKRFSAVAPAPPAASGARPGAGPPPEQADLEAMGAELSKRPWRANIPLVVLTRTPPVATDIDPRGRIWQELQQELATRSPQAEHIIAGKSGHYIQNDEPALVFDAIRRVVDGAAKRHGPLY